MSQTPERTERAYWSEASTRLVLETRSWIADRPFPSSCDRDYQIINPATGAAIAQAPEGASEDVDAAVRVARNAFNKGSWARMAPQERRSILLRWSDLLRAHQDELALLDCLNIGKPISQALDDVELASACLRFCGEACDKLADQVLPSGAGMLALGLREPVGVVAAITPWNFPIVVAAMKVAPALAAGNALILKPSEISPLSAIRFAELAMEAGLPPGVLNVVVGLGDTVGGALGEHPDIDMVTFTGSTRTGQRLMQAAAQSNLKKVILECGGKSPAIVFADTPDLDVTAEDIVTQITWNQGQVCVASARLLVESSIHDVLVAKVVERMRAITPSDPLDPATRFGPLASRIHFDRVLSHVERGLAAGAALRLGGTSSESAGYFFSPTVFENVSPHMALAREEIFGPVLSVLRFETFDEALSLANDVEYGLSARVWTGDLARGYALGRALRVGEVTVSSHALESVGPGLAAPIEPFGKSGFGVEGGLEGIRQYTRSKVLHLNIQPRS